MGKDTAISWTDHTGGPFLGCTKVSAGCANCYAAALAESSSPVSFGRIIRKAYKAAGLTDWESRPIWGDNAPRVLNKSFWSDAVRIDAQNRKAGTRTKWFPSLIDWLDEMPAGIMSQDGTARHRDAVRAQFLDLIRVTPHIDWLLLTKRPENWNRLTSQSAINMPTESGTHWIDEWLSGTPPANVWLGTTVENQEQADKRIPALLDIPAKIRFLSCEPLLGPVDLWGATYKTHGQTGHTGAVTSWEGCGVDWVICGGESGAQARAMHPDWARTLRDQCAAARVPFHFKQWGEWANIGIPPAGEKRMGWEHRHTFPDDTGMQRVGTARAGRLLDGKLHDAFPH